MRPEILAQHVGAAIKAAVLPLKQEIQELKRELAALDGRNTRQQAAIVSLQDNLREAQDHEPSRPRDVH